MIRLQVGMAVATNIQAVPKKQHKPPLKLFCLHPIAGVNESKAEMLCADGVPCTMMMDATMMG